jgi:HlyD family secretion protein
MVLAGASFVMHGRTGEAQGPSERLRRSEVRPAAFDITLRVPGVVESAKGVSINNWVLEKRSIVWIMPDGSRVKEGDVIMRLDSASQQKALNELKKTNVEREKSERESIASAEQRERNSITALEKSKEDFKIMQIKRGAEVEKAEAEIAYLQKEVELAQAQYDKKMRLATEKLMALRDVDAASDELRGKQFQLAQAVRSLDQAKRDAETEVEAKKFDLKKTELEAASAKSSLAQAKSQAQRAQAIRQDKITDAEAQVANCEIKANANGMLLVGQTWTEGERILRNGDQTGNGQRLAKIIDPGNMRVRCDINESDIERVHSGQKAFVRVPALGKRALEGTITAVDNMAKGQDQWESGAPIFSAIITLSAHEEKLRPGMGATVEILLEKVTKGLAVPLEAVFKKGDGCVVFQSDGQRYREIPVKVGKRNEMTAAVRGALRAGDKLACERPSAAQLLEAKGN